MDAMTDGPETDAKSHQAARVLLATSDSATRELLRRILHVGAIEIIEASDGVESLALIRRLDLDLVLLDAFLAVLDGISVCERIRALPDIDTPPIIIVGLSSERAVEVALASGADETIAKPLNLALIRHRTRRLLKRRLEEKRLNLMRRAVEAAPVGMTILDARSSEYSMTYANPAIHEMTGYAADELGGRNLRLLKGPDTDVTAMTELRDAFAEGRSCNVLLKNYRKDGQPFWNDLAVAPIVDASGRLTHYVAVQHDVTKLLQAPEHADVRAIDKAVADRTHDLDSALARVEERRRFTETILNAMVSGMLAADAGGVVTFANRSALRTLGASLADCVGRSVVEIFGHNEDLAEVIGARAAPHQEHRLDFPFISPGGEKFYVGMSITRAPEELRDEVGFIFLFRNLAETIEDESDPRLQLLGEEDATAGRGPRARAIEKTPQGDATFASIASGFATDVQDEDELTDEGAAVRRRAQLALRYCAPVDLARSAVDALGTEFENRTPPIRIEPEDDLPDVLVDRQQITEALTKLVISAAHRCNDPALVRLRIDSAEAVGDKGVRLRPSVRFNILFPRAQITEQDLGGGADTAARQTRRQMDLTSVERLVEANGGRLIRPARDGDELSFEVLLPSAH
ncbi:MAG: PAS domain S-box protein [Vicinamibacteria bacterium]|nr:PAS domain S-box protein [Vicinamibacteria bacterium]